MLATIESSRLFMNEKYIDVIDFLEDGYGSYERSELYPPSIQGIMYSMYHYLDRVIIEYALDTNDIYWMGSSVKYDVLDFLEKNKDKNYVDYIDEQYDSGMSLLGNPGDPLYDLIFDEIKGILLQHHVSFCDIERYEYMYGDPNDFSTDRNAEQTKEAHFFNLPVRSVW